MKAWLIHPFRVTMRLAWLAGELMLAATEFWYRCGFRSEGDLRIACGIWLQRHARRMLRIFGATILVKGPIPSSGLLVSNHLSYLDILTLGSITPAVFVAKSDVKRWPVFGNFARMAGTLFVRRENRLEAARAANEIETALCHGSLVVLFPEGTSSGGETVLPFKSSLLEPAVRNPGSLFAACIQYELDDGDVSEEVCYWKDMILLPHLVNLLSKRAVRASVRFKQLHHDRADRKELARQLHCEVLSLKVGSLV